MRIKLEYLNLALLFASKDATRRELNGVWVTPEGLIFGLNGYALVKCQGRDLSDELLAPVQLRLDKPIPKGKQGLVDLDVSTGVLSVVGGPRVLCEVRADLTPPAWENVWPQEKEQVPVEQVGIAGQYLSLIAKVGDVVLTFHGALEAILFQRCGDPDVSGLVMPMALE